MEFTKHFGYNAAHRLRFPRPPARTRQSARAGELLNINAYDQPAVELGKKATFALMGRAGYEETAKEIIPFAQVDEKYVV